MATEYEVRGKYDGPHGWEAVSTEPTRKMAKARLREYLENERGIPFKIVRVKATDAVRVRLYRAGRWGRGVVALLVDQYKDGYGVPFASFEVERHGGRVFGILHCPRGAAPLGYPRTASKSNPKARKLLEALAEHLEKAVEVIK